MSFYGEIDLIGRGREVNQFSSNFGLLGLAARLRFKVSPPKHGEGVRVEPPRYPTVPSKTSSPLRPSPPSGPRVPRPTEPTRTSKTG